MITKIVKKRVLSQPVYEPGKPIEEVELTLTKKAKTKRKRKSSPRKNKKFKMMPEDENDLSLAIKTEPADTTIDTIEEKYANFREKKRRCGQCEGCKKEDCAVCKFCLDKPKFGGPSTLRQRCILKRVEDCVNPISVII